MKHLITPPNPYSAPRMTYDYSIQAEITYIRWHDHATYKEIAFKLEEHYGIFIEYASIGTILKCYEIAASQNYRSDFLEVIKNHGGLFVCIDVMEPLQGRKGILVAYDYWTGLTLGAIKMPNGKQTTYESFLRKMQARIKTHLKRL